MIRVMAVDDHPLFLAGVSKTFAATPDIRLVGLAFDAREVVDLARQHLPDVVLMDIQMPQLNGIAAARELHDAVPSCKLVALSGFDLRPIVLEMLEAGAVGYVLKDSVEVDIVAAVRAVMAGAVFITPRLRSMIPRRLLSPNTFAPPRLTAREEEVLRSIAQGTPRKRVAERLGMSPRTVEYHVHQMMVRLEVDSLADLIRYATAKGWVSDGSPPEPRAGS
jgi:two-component system, NarL family, nitrate/nitrite response regulator NarL